MDLQTQSSTKPHSYFDRKAKLCVRCKEQLNMPSSSYCKDCNREYNRESRVKRNVARQGAMDNFVNRFKCDIVNNED